MAFVQFRYRTENSTFIGALGDLLRARRVRGLFITDDEDASIGARSGTLRVVLTGSSQRRSNRAASARPAASEASPRASALKLALYLLKKDVKRALELFRHARAAYASISREDQLTAIVGIEPQGGLAAGLIARLLRKPFFYCSMELNTPAFASRPVSNLFMAVWRRTLRRAILVTVQDEDRAAVLCKAARIEAGRISILPVGTTAPARHEKNLYLHRRLNIDPTMKIVVYAGSIRPWACLLEIAASTASWPPDYLLVIHGFAERDDDPYLNALRERVDGRRVYLSTTPVAWSELDDLLCSAHVSIAAYAELGANTDFIASSSNKLASYARCGLPAVIRQSDSVSRMFDKVRWGAAFNEWDAIGQAIETIDQDHAGYRRRSFEAFHRFYDLNALGGAFADAITGERTRESGDASRDTDSRRSMPR